MKTFLRKTPVLISAVLITLSCSKENSAPAPVTATSNVQEENFFEGFLTSTSFSQKTTSNVNESDYEFGFEFEPLVKGKITVLKVKLPDIRNDLKVTIWDKLTGNILRTEILNVSAVNTVFTFDIIDLELVKNKQYAITMNSNDFYFRSKSNDSPITYPITVGNFKILSNKYILGATQTYPTTELFSYCNGDLSFNFLKTE